ncbi:MULTISPECIES: hypothetical protein [Eubacterium]|uniref:Uncharacterized protein n=1 Tax=Eubacterium barkeri TaxID=1528 RepID=A0A1H3G084_EUBBA|nr:hypothetical protein [Eubacterium barkeri]SDX96723.1 hypothetical protein SAMN04488579_11241 [Eubacterium barkeri]
MAIHIRIPRMLEEQWDEPGIQQELNQAERILKGQGALLTDGRIHFIFIKGEYRQVMRQLKITGLLINKTGSPLHSISASIHLRFNDFRAIIRPRIVSFPGHYIGTLWPEEGLLFHSNFQVKGKMANQVFSALDISGSMENIHFSQEKIGVAL